KPEDVSSVPFSGYTFTWSTRSKALMYNTKLISADQMPQKVTDMADPRFKGKYTVPPWTDAWELGIQLYTDKQAWIQTIDQIGKDAIGVVDFSPALSRLLLRIPVRADEHLLLLGRQGQGSERPGRLE